MSDITLDDLRASVNEKRAFADLDDYRRLTAAYLEFIAHYQPTRIISPSRSHYVFYQYGEDRDHRITRPLNSHLFYESAVEFNAAFERFFTFLAELATHQDRITRQSGIDAYLQSREISRTIYTVQQAAGCILDAFPESNQARKRVGQLFERLIKVVIRSIGLECESRTIVLPIPDYAGYTMPYELDLVFSRNKVILTQETKTLYPNEIVGSVKTTSKDRIDKIFLDKHLLTRLLGRDVPVVAVFLHDVQRAKRGQSIFGINSTFKSNHFLGYTVALNRLDGVYYIDLAPEMMTNALLREEIRDFQRFLVTDLWMLSRE